ncbi:MAG: peptide deformylase [Rikenellaceae bacterium]|jgi:peptide deformylase|nr:peptide deformylase [Rikenellaceae bacterium]
MKNDTFTAEERQLIGRSAEAGVMRVLKSDCEADSLQLRELSLPLTAEDLQSETYTVLKARMLATVNDPDNEGVGIAAPQVGIRKQLIAVERHDRPEPEFAFYANPRIERYSEEKALGREGCLSVPNRTEAVPRSTAIVISYLDEQSGQRVEETVEGFTAVIFQHEIDHLAGILYIDRK